MAFVIEKRRKTDTATHLPQEIIFVVLGMTLNYIMAQVALLLKAP